MPWVQLFYLYSLLCTSQSNLTTRSHILIFFSASKNQLILSSKPPWSSKMLGIARPSPYFSLKWTKSHADTVPCSSNFFSQREPNLSIFTLSHCSGKTNKPVHSFIKWKSPHFSKKEVNRYCKKSVVCCGAHKSLIQSLTYGKVLHEESFSVGDFGYFMFLMHFLIKFIVHLTCDCPSCLGHVLFW